MSAVIQTFLGDPFDILDPCPDDVNIITIAHALSNLCRFTGHTTEFYSVAQHSALVSTLVPPEYALHGLMHDAAEAFVGDVSTPLKNALPEYRTIENRVWRAIAEAFNLPEELPHCVHEADRVALAIEKRDMLDDPVGDFWGDMPATPGGVHISALAPNAACDLFMTRFWEITNG